jgi:hypothetical protein
LHREDCTEEEARNASQVPEISMEDAALGGYAEGLTLGFQSLKPNPN